MRLKVTGYVDLDGEEDLIDEGNRTGLTAEGYDQLIGMSSGPLSGLHVADLQDLETEIES